MPTTKKKEEQTQLPVQNVSNQNQPQQTGNGYQSKWQPQINDAVNQYLKRDQFKYDVNEDALYQQMKDMYVMQGQKAMMDTMGHTTALTGGYGNSWAQGAGQQAYQGYIQQLNDQIPDLYQMALNQYMNEGDQMAQNIGMMMEQDSIDYGQYRDMIADQQWQESFDYGKSRDEIADQQWRETFDYSKSRDELANQEDAYNKLLGLMENYDYIPTAEEMAAAGMPESHMQAIMKDYLASLQGGGGGGYYYSGNPNPAPKPSDDETAAYNFVTSMWNSAVEGGSSRFNPYAVVNSTNKLTASQKAAAQEIIKEFESTGAFKTNKKLS